MLTRLRQWIQTTPAITNPIQRQQAPMLQMIILGIALLITLLIIVTFTAGNSDPVGTLSLCVSLLLAVMSLALLRRGHFNVGVAVLISLSLLPSIGVLMQRGFNSYWSTFFSLSLPLILGGLLGNRRILWLTVAISIAVLGWVSIGTLISPEQYQIAIDTSADNQPIAIIAQFIVFGIQVIFVGMCFATFGQVLQRLIIAGLERQNELETLRAEQERIIEERTHDLRSSLQMVAQREQELARTLADLQSSKEIISAISAPTIPVMPGVLLVPIVGNLDRQRAEAMTTNTLSAVEKQHSHAVIFDITGVEVVDTHVAQVLLRTASAATLLGAGVIMVGIRPEVAQTMVALGIDLSMFTTYSDLRSALTELLMREGWAMREQVTR